MTRIDRPCAWYRPFRMTRGLEPASENCLYCLSDASWGRCYRSFIHWAIYSIGENP